MTIAYIESNAKRRTLLILVVAFLWAILPVQVLAELFTRGWKSAKWRIIAELTGDGHGFWRSVADCWRAPIPYPF